MTGFDGPPLLPPEMPWWRRPWIGLAAAILLVEIAALFLLSAESQSTRPESLNPRPRRPRADYRVESPSFAEGSTDAWALLLSPNVLLTPSAHDFSGRSWLADPVTDLPLEDAAGPVVAQPLPFRPLRTLGIEDLRYHDFESPERWSPPEFAMVAPKPAPVPVPTAGDVRTLQGLENWKLDRPPTIPPLPNGSIVSRTVIRLVLDDSGTPATPPFVWESSGEAVADEAALAIVRQLEWTAVDRRLAAATVGAAGLVAVSWPVDSP